VIAVGERVVVTGMGAVTPLGGDIESTWQSALEGQSGIGPITLFDPSGMQCRIAAEVKDFDPTRYMPAKEARRNDRSVHLAMAAAHQAVNDAGLAIDESNADDIGVILGSGVGGIGSLSDQYDVMRDKGPQRISPFLVPMYIVDMVAGMVSIALGAKGVNYSIVSACATSGHCIGEAAEVIKRGDASVMVAGGSEAGIVPIGIGAFDAMRALSTRNDEPTRASRPFDVERDGFVMGEAGAVMVLEALAHAQDRGAPIHGELVGHGATGDAYHITSPAESGEGAVRSMRIALEKAKLQPRDVEYINAHATSTPNGDRAETNAIKTLFGPAAYDVPVSSTKSMTGHLMGAGAAVEAMFCLLAMRDSTVPPTTNLEEADPACDLDYVPNAARKKKVEIALSNSFGFGGHNNTLVFKAFHE
jgi:3-oxoacyl-[acyl-carrier-protein] synthase II